MCPPHAAPRTATHLVEAVLLPVPHRQVVLTIPKRLRIYFCVDRRLLAELARAAARAITEVVRVSTGERRGAPGIICVVALTEDIPTRRLRHTRSLPCGRRNCSSEPVGSGN